MWMHRRAYIIVNITNRTNSSPLMNMNDFHILIMLTCMINATYYKDFIE